MTISPKKITNSILQFSGQRDLEIQKSPNWLDLFVLMFIRDVIFFIFQYEV